MKKKDLKLTFTALGGLGEIGANCYVYNLLNTVDDDLDEILVADLGMGFYDGKTTSVDTYFPNIDFLINNKKKIKGLAITHGHEDHIGAIAILWKELKCPIYATRWLADLIYEKLKEYNLHKAAKIHVIEYNQAYKIGSFQLTWSEITHSTISSSLILINTPLGNLVHSGDFKLGSHEKEFIKNFKNIGRENIKYLMCDSTNVLDEGFTEHEDILKADLHKLIKSCNGVCWITSFSSNLERLRNIAAIAKLLKKKIVIFGRSINTNVRLAIKHKYLEDNIFVLPEDIKKHNRNKLIYFVTGGQGEYKSVLFNVLVENSFKEKIQPEDSVIFSTRIIPGNETKVNRLHNLLSKAEIQFYTPDHYKIHVSGHPKQQDLKLLYQAINPEYIIPIHGEHIHLKSHTVYAKTLNYKSVNIEDGDVLELFPGKPEIIGKIATGRLFYEGFRTLSSEDLVFRHRAKIFFEGTAFVSVIMQNNNFESINISSLGLLTDSETKIIKPKLEDKLKIYLTSILKNSKLADSQIQEAARVFVRRHFKDTLGKKPMVTVHLNNPSN